MKHDRHTTRFAWISSQVAVVSAMVVVLTVITLPGCPRLPSFPVGQDARTVTENRGVVEHFSTPGHILLHGLSSTSAVCDACEQADPEQQTATSPVLTIDVTTRDTGGLREPQVGDIAAVSLPASETAPADHIARVPAPPPRLI